MLALVDVGAASTASSSSPSPNAAGRLRGGACWGAFGLALRENESFIIAEGHAACVTRTDFKKSLHFAMAQAGSDRRRITGPEDSNPPLFAPDEKERSGDVRQGRNAGDVRPICTSGF